jgi:hypothetical protein
MNPPSVCARCRERLPDDALPQVRTCRDYSHWRARQAGDTRTTAEADALMLFRLWCGLDEALWEGRAEIRADV